MEDKQPSFAEMLEEYRRTLHQSQELYDRTSKLLEESMRCIQENQQLLRNLRSSKASKTEIAKDGRERLQKTEYPMQDFVRGTHSS